MNNAARAPEPTAPAVETHSDDKVDALIRAACDAELEATGFSSSLDRLCRLREDVRAHRARGRQASPGTGNDDEDVLPDPEDLAEIVAALNEEFGSPSQNVIWADVVREIDAHRARGGQTAGR